MVDSLSNACRIKIEHRTFRRRLSTLLAIRFALQTDELRRAKRGQIDGVVGKGKTQGDVFLSLDARRALAGSTRHRFDYADVLRKARALPADKLFLAAKAVYLE